MGHHLVDMRLRLELSHTDQVHPSPKTRVLQTQKTATAALHGRGFLPETTGFDWSDCQIWKLLFGMLSGGRTRHAPFKFTPED